MLFRGGEIKSKGPFWSPSWKQKTSEIKSNTDLTILVDVPE